MNNGVRARAQLDPLCSVLQAEIVGVGLAAKIPTDVRRAQRNCAIYSDSGDVVNSLSRDTVTSRCTRKCKIILIVLASANAVRFE